jgi:hypothetical protein
MPQLSWPVPTVLLGAGLAVGLLTGCKEPENERVMPSQAFVWQRVWRPAVAEAVRTATAFEALHVLAAELSFKNSEAELITVEPDWPSLQQSGRAVGAVLRLHTSVATGPAPQASAKAIQDLAAITLKRFATAGVPLTELQLDYDCPQSRLADYTQLLRELKTRLHTIPLHITALPAWLDEPSVQALLEESPDYVLQVHSLQLPEAGAPATLFHPVEARRAVSRAAAIGIPFRVALPTYSCVVELDDAGRVREVHGEDVPAGLALTGRRHLVLDSDAFVLSEWLADLRRHPPAALSALIWYRLPIATDRLNWPPETLTQVVAGKALQRRWQSSLERRADDAFEIQLHQAGDAPDDLPREIQVDWPTRATAAADGLRGYRVTELNATRLILQLQQPERHGRIRPGTRLISGWLRFEGNPGEFSLQVRR